MASVHARCEWQVWMEGVNGKCACEVRMGGVRMGGVDGRCGWEVCMIGMHGRCGWEVRMGAVDECW